MGIPVVKVRRDDVPGGFVIMNQSDFDPETMVLYDGNQSGENRDEQGKIGTASVASSEGTAKAPRKRKDKDG